jgi:hypothetical protein
VNRSGFSTVRCVSRGWNMLPAADKTLRGAPILEFGAFLQSNSWLLGTIFQLECFLGGSDSACEVGHLRVGKKPHRYSLLARVGEWIYRFFGNPGVTMASANARGSGFGDMRGFSPLESSTLGFLPSASPHAFALRKNAICGSHGQAATLFCISRLNGWRG